MSLWSLLLLCAFQFLLSIFRFTHFFGRLSSHGRGSIQKPTDGVLRGCVVVVGFFLFGLSLTAGLDGVSFFCITLFPSIIMSVSFPLNGSDRHLAA